MKLKKRPVGLTEIKARCSGRPSKTMSQVMAEMKRDRAYLEEKIGPLDQLGLEPNVVERLVGSHNRYLNRNGESPVEAHARGVGYSGPLLPDKSPEGRFLQSNGLPVALARPRAVDHDGPHDRRQALLLCGLRDEVP